MCISSYVCYNNTQEFKTKISTEATSDDQADVKISEQMQSIIGCSTQFSAKPIGPIHACINDRQIKASLPSSFLNTYIVDNNADCDSLKKLCEQHNEPVPDRIVYPFSQKLYDDLEKDPKADIGMIESLKQENPTIANVLVDYLNLHVMDMHSRKQFEC